PKIADRLAVRVFKRTSPEARRMIGAGARNARRLRSRGRQSRTYGPGWCCIGISVYPEDLKEMVLVVSRLRTAGMTDMSRSKLIRIAFHNLDIDSIVADAK